MVDKKEFYKMAEEFEQHKRDKKEKQEFQNWKKNKGKGSDLSSVPKPKENQKQEKQVKGMVSVKACAIEALKIRRFLHFVLLGGIMGAFGQLAFTIFSAGAGMGFSIIFMIAFVVVMMINRKELLYLNQMYKV